MHEVDFQSKNTTGKASKCIFNCGGVCSVLSVISNILQYCLHKNSITFKKFEKSAFDQSANK